MDATAIIPSMPWKPDVTVAAVVERDGQFLFVEERASGRVVLNQPAGHLEKNESFLEAVAREALEETGWTFVPEAVTGIYVWQPEHLTRTFLRVAFAGRLARHAPARPLDHGILRTRWLDRDQLVTLQARHRSPLVLRCVDDYLAGTRYPLGLLSHLLASRQTSEALAASG
jgi:8-oxo-dGTP pyrophosphatase MutT (NUDIX family)